MRLRTAILVGVIALIAATLAGTVIAVTGIVNRSAVDRLDDDLARSHAVFDELLSFRAELGRNECRVVAEEPRLKAVVASEEVERETVLDVAQTLHKTVASDLFLLLDSDGLLLVDVLVPDAEGYDFSDRAVVQKALADGDGSDVWADDAHAYQVSARRLAFGARVVGVLIIGRAIDDAAATTIHRQTGSSVAVLLDGKVIAASALEGGAAPDRAALAAALARPGDAVHLGGEDYRVEVGPLPGYTGERAASVALLRSEDRALAPGRRATRLVYIMAAIASLLAVALAVTLARALSRPIDELVRFTRTIAAGELDRRAAVAGPAEVRELGRAMNNMATELEQSRADVAEKERLEQEMTIAARIQTSILPRSFDIDGLEVAARMVPASEVGGDYYDVIPVSGGAWIAIGDAAGHGLDAGLVMLMAQTSVASLVAAQPDATPSALLSQLNAVLWENVHERLEADRHMTMTLVRYHADGRLVHAGAHMDIAVVRAADGACEQVPTRGTFLGITDDISAVTKDAEITLADGDLVVFHTDGVTEAMNADGDMYGADRMADTLAAAAGQAPTAVVANLFKSVGQWGAEQVDDVTVLALRYRPSA